MLRMASTMTALDAYLKRIWKVHLTPATACEVVAQLVADDLIDRSQAVAMLNTPTATERTCTTCSKTCDVGQKCWWCGNE